MDALLHDLRYAIRSLRSTPGFTGVAVFTLAVGIGATTAVFTLLNALVLRPLPVRQPQQLVEPMFKYPRDPRLNSYAWKHYEQFRDGNHVFTDVVAMSRARLQAADASGAENLEGVYVSANFFDGLGVRPAVGRVVGPQENRGAVALISWSYWRSRFNRDPAIVGKSLTLNEVPVTIVGVLPSDFFGLQVGVNPAIWLPVSAEPLLQKPSRLADGTLIVAIVARLKPGVTRAQAEAEMRVLNRTRIAELEARVHDGQWSQTTIVLEPAAAGLSVLRDRFASSVLLMTAAGTVLLLIACINVASMLLARAAARRREVAVRIALGAGRWRLVRQMLTESLLLASAASVIGLWLAYTGAHALVNLIASGRPPVGMPRLDIPVPLDLRVLGFACAAGLLTGLAFGGVPAWRSLASLPALTLHEMRTGDTRSTTRFGTALVVAQVALSIVLVNSAALFVRHLMDLRTVGLGFQTDSVVQAVLDWSGPGYTPAQISEVNRQLLDRIGANPAVRSVTLAGMTPISGAAGSQFITVPGFDERPNDRRRVSLNIVTPQYFETLSTPFGAGRDFSPADAGGRRIAIVNQSMAHYYFGASNPIGRLFVIDGHADRPLKIVGVVADAKYQDLHETPPRTFYMNALQGGGLGSNKIVVMRTRAGAIATVAADVQRAVREIAPTLPAAQITTLAEQLDASILPERLISLLSTFFGVAAAVLVAIGLYGLLAYSVARRVKEIGIRIAIGATQANVIRMVVMRALGMVVAGLAIGVPIAIWSKGYATYLLSLVAATQAGGPITLPTRGLASLTIAAAAITGVALGASYLPARRAARVDPMVALRAE
jgi:predicted permease